MHYIDPRAPRYLSDVGLVPDDIANHPHLSRAHAKTQRDRLIADGIIVPEVPDRLYDPAWFRERIAALPCLTLQ